MPRGDAMGPWGQGPMTGRGAGFCAGFSAPGFANPAPGRGYGFGRGFARGGGRGWRHWYYATGLPGWARGWCYPPASMTPFSGEPTPEQEAAALKAQVEDLSAGLEGIRKRLDEPKGHSGG